ncbi:MAG: hypothetical protein GYB68_04165 [Chloroflexi bacterium]|nr:hypothetical protein [Chloroflexota bacterium]
MWVMAILLAVIVFGVGLRLYQLGAQPAGLYQDEAVNGLDALAILQGELPLYFPANNGREPLFVYVMALTTALFGNTMLGVRAASALLGIATIGAVYWLGAVWKSPRLGLLCAAVMSSLLWHVHLSRVGFRAVSLPLLIALCFALAGVAIKTRSKVAWIGAGAAYGLLFYTYLPARFSPLALALSLLYAWVWHRDWFMEQISDHWRDYLWAFAAAAIVLLPLAWLTLSQPELVFGRSGQVAIWNPAVHQGNPIGTALNSIGSSLGMFTWRGDWIWRHNVPNRPVFDLLLSMAFFLGLLLAGQRWGVSPALAISVIWLVVMLLPTTLAEDAPHFLRAVGVLPMAAIIPALALDEGLDLLERLETQPVLKRLLPIGLALVPVVSMGFTTRDYFGCRGPFALSLNGFNYVGCYQSDEVRGFFFQQQATELALEANEAPGALIIDQRFWESFPSLRYLLDPQREIILVEETENLPQIDPPFTVIAWPHGDLSRVYEGLQSNLHSEAQVSVVPGPDTRGDNDPTSYQLYVMWQVTTANHNPEPLARFANDLILEDVNLERNGARLSVALSWRSDQPLASSARVFAHLLGDNPGELLAQVDEPPGTIAYSPLSWPQGSVIIHPITLMLPPGEAQSAPTAWQIRVGLYDPVSLERIPPVESRVPTGDDALLIDVAPSQD